MLNEGKADFWQSAEGSDYLVRELEPNHYEVSKWTRGDSPADIYQVYDRGKGRWHCSCPAKGVDKHVKIVKDWIKKGKPGTDDLDSKAKKLYKLLKKLGVNTK